MVKSLNSADELSPQPFLTSSDTPHATPQSELTQKISASVDSEKFHELSLPPSHLDVSPMITGESNSDESFLRTTNHESSLTYPHEEPSTSQSLTKTSARRPPGSLTDPYVEPSTSQSQTKTPARRPPSPPIQRTFSGNTKDPPPTRVPVLILPPSTAPIVCPYVRDFSAMYRRHDTIPLSNIAPEEEWQLVTVSKQNTEKPVRDLTPKEVAERIGAKFKILQARYFI